MKRLFKNLLAMGMISAMLVVGLIYWLGYYTGHDEPTVEVPEVKNVLSGKAIRVLQNAGLEAIISDTVYKHNVGKLNVVSQNPEPGSKVKKGRKIYLVINSDRIPKVRMPDLAGKTSLKQAKNILKRRGLELGRVIKIYDPSVMSPNDEPVLAQYRHRDSVSISEGARIEKYSKIDLLVGEMKMESIDSTELTQ